MEDEQDLVASVLRSTPPPDVRPGFVVRVNARIDADERAGWLALADFRLWTLRLAPAAAVLALVAALTARTSSTSSTSSTAVPASAASTSRFDAASSADWQKDVSGDALLEAALTPRGGGSDR